MNIDVIILTLACLYLFLCISQASPKLVTHSVKLDDKENDDTPNWKEVLLTFPVGIAWFCQENFWLWLLLLIALSGCALGVSKLLTVVKVEPLMDWNKLLPLCGAGVMVLGLLYWLLPHSTTQSLVNTNESVIYAHSELFEKPTIAPANKVNQNLIVNDDSSTLNAPALNLNNDETQFKSSQSSSFKLTTTIALSIVFGGVVVIMLFTELSKPKNKTGITSLLLLFYCIALVLMPWFSDSFWKYQILSFIWFNILACQLYLHSKDQTGLAAMPVVASIQYLVLLVISAIAMHIIHYVL